MKKLLLVIVLMLVAVVFVSSPVTSNPTVDSEKGQTSNLGFEDFENSDLAAPWGPVNP